MLGIYFLLLSSPYVLITALLDNFCLPQCNNVTIVVFQISFCSGHSCASWTYSWPAGNNLSLLMACIDDTTFQHYES